MIPSSLVWHPVGLWNRDQGGGQAKETQEPAHRAAARGHVGCHAVGRRVKSLRACSTPFRPLQGDPPPAGADGAVIAERQRSALNGPNTDPSASDATVEAANGTTGGDGKRRHEDTITKSRFTATTERRIRPDSAAPACDQPPALDHSLITPRITRASAKEPRIHWPNRTPTDHPPVHTTGSGKGRERPPQTWRFAGPTGVPPSHLPGRGAPGRNLPAEGCARCRAGTRSPPSPPSGSARWRHRPARAARRSEADRGFPTVEAYGVEHSGAGVPKAPRRLPVRPPVVRARGLDGRQ